MSKTERDSIVQIEDEDLLVVFDQTTGKVTNSHWLGRGVVFAYFTVPEFFRYMFKTRFNPQPREMYFAGFSMAGFWRVRAEFRFLERR
jgi:hypothetical protein